MLDEAGFPEAKIVGSGDLDEHVIEDLNRRGAAIGVWGVGTRLTTAYDDPALSGVYKISAIREEDGNWSYKLKVSEESGKTSNPGILQVRRFQRGERYTGDIIYDELHPPAGRWTMVDLAAEERREVPPGEKGEDLLVPVFRQGQCVYGEPRLEAIRDRVRSELACFPDAIQRISRPEEYPVGLEEGLQSLKLDLIRQAKSEEVRRE
jgi:nicotinate phosphoribosyltransferase